MTARGSSELFVVLVDFSLDDGLLIVHQHKRQSQSAKDQERWCGSMLGSLNRGRGPEADAHSESVIVRP